MWIYLVAGAVATFYLMNLPVCMGAQVHLGDGHRIRLGLGFFGHAWTWEMRVKFDAPLISRLAQRTEARSGGRPGRLKAPILGLWRHVAVRKFEMAFSTGDACLTALGCGFLRAVCAVLLKKARVRPDFGTQRAYLALVCILEVRLGQIVYAALRFMASAIGGRVQRWKSERLKASWQARWNPFATWWT
ncbi:MAG: hypothetical protein RR296_10155 [Clostridia bacterium]